MLRPCAGCGDLGVGHLCCLCVTRRAKLRLAAVMAMRCDGMNLREIGEVLHLSTERIRHLAWQAERRIFVITVDGKIQFSRTSDYRAAIPSQRKEKTMSEETNIPEAEVPAETPATDTPAETPAE